MSNLVIIQENQILTTSKMVAEAFDKQHKDVLRDIKNLDCSEEFTRRNFAPCLYASELGNNVTRQLPYYNITRDGFTFLAMGYTGKRAAEFKEAYIKAFNEMEQQLKSASVPENKYSIEDLIIAQATSMKEIRMELESLKNQLPAPAPQMPAAIEPVEDQPQIDLFTTDRLYSVAEYMHGKNFNQRSKALIGFWAKKYSVQNSLKVLTGPLGNKYLPQAIEHGLGQVILSNKPYLNAESSKLIKDIKNDPIAQDLIKLKVGALKSYRANLKSKVKRTVYNRLNQVDDFKFSISLNHSWITVRRIA